MERKIDISMATTAIWLVFHTVYLKHSQSAVTTAVYSVWLPLEE